MKSDCVRRLQNIRSAGHVNGTFIRRHCENQTTQGVEICNKGIYDWKRGSVGIGAVHNFWIEYNLINSIMIANNITCNGSSWECVLLFQYGRNSEKQYT